MVKLLIEWMRRLRSLSAERWTAAYYILPSLTGILLIETEFMRLSKREADCTEDLPNSARLLVEAPKHFMQHNEADARQTRGPGEAPQPDNAAMDLETDGITTLVPPSPPNSIRKPLVGSRRHDSYFGTRNSLSNSAGQNL